MEKLKLEDMESLTLDLEILLDFIPEIPLLFEYVVGIIGLLALIVVKLLRGVHILEVRYGVAPGALELKVLEGFVHLDHLLVRLAHSLFVHWFGLEFGRLGQVPISFLFDLLFKYSRLYS